MVTQEDVNRFLDMSKFIDPQRKDVDRMNDLIWRFPECALPELGGMYVAWVMADLTPPLPVVQREIEAL